MLDRLLADIEAEPDGKRLLRANQGFGFTSTRGALLAVREWLGG